MNDSAKREQELLNDFGEPTGFCLACNTITGYNKRWCSNKCAEVWWKRCNFLIEDDENEGQCVQR